MNRINGCENKETWKSKRGRQDSDKHFLASGESERAIRPIDLIL